MSKTYEEHVARLALLLWLWLDRKFRVEGKREYSSYELWNVVGLKRRTSVFSALALLQELDVLKKEKRPAVYIYTGKEPPERVEDVLRMFKQRSRRAS